jgi:hypothetical protein
MRSSLLLTAVLVSVGIAIPLSGRAQQPQLNSEITIQKIEPAFVESPKISSPGYTKKSQGRALKWLEIEVVFDRIASAKSPKYADELTFNYYILLKNEAESEDGKPTLLTGSVIHVHTPQEKALHSVAYVSPRTLAKFFAGKVPVNVAQSLADYGVTVSGKEGLLAIHSMKPQGVKGGKGWWDDASPYSVVPGKILNKDETPFAPFEWDYFEPVKSKSAN